MKLKKILSLLMLLLVVACNEGDEKLVELHKKIMKMPEASTYFNDFDAKWKENKETYLKVAKDIFADIDNESIDQVNSKSQLAKLVEIYGKNAEILVAGEKFYENRFFENTRMKKVMNHNYLIGTIYNRTLIKYAEGIYDDINKGADPFSKKGELDLLVDSHNTQMAAIKEKLKRSYARFIDDHTELTSVIGKYHTEQFHVYNIPSITQSTTGRVNSNLDKGSKTNKSRMNHSSSVNVERFLAGISQLEDLKFNNKVRNFGLKNIEYLNVADFLTLVEGVRKTNTSSDDDDSQVKNTLVEKFVKINLSNFSIEELKDVVSEHSVLTTRNSFVERYFNAHVGELNLNMFSSLREALVDTRSTNTYDDYYINERIVKKYMKVHMNYLRTGDVVFIAGKSMQKLTNNMILEKFLTAHVKNISLKELYTLMDNVVDTRSTNTYDDQYVLERMIIKYFDQYKGTLNLRDAIELIRHLPVKIKVNEYIENYFNYHLKALRSSDVSYIVNELVETRSTNTYDDDYVSERVIKSYFKVFLESMPVDEVIMLSAKANLSYTTNMLIEKFYNKNLNRISDSDYNKLLNALKRTSSSYVYDDDQVRKRMIDKWAEKF